MTDRNLTVAGWLRDLAELSEVPAELSGDPSCADMLRAFAHHIGEPSRSAAWHALGGWARRHMMALVADPEITLPPLEPTPTLRITAPDGVRLVGDVAVGNRPYIAAGWVRGPASTSTLGDWTVETAGTTVRVTVIRQSDTSIRGTVAIPHLDLDTGWEAIYSKAHDLLYTVRLPWASVPPSVGSAIVATALANRSPDSEDYRTAVVCYWIDSPVTRIPISDYLVVHPALMPAYDARLAAETRHGRNPLRRTAANAMRLTLRHAPRNKLGLVVVPMPPWLLRAGSAFRPDPVRDLPVADTTPPDGADRATLQRLFDRLTAQWQTGTSRAPISVSRVDIRMDDGTRVGLLRCRGGDDVVFLPTTWVARRREGRPFRTTFADPWGNLPDRPLRLAAGGGWAVLSDGVRARVVGTPSPALLLDLLGRSHRAVHVDTPAYADMLGSLGLPATTAPVPSSETVAGMEALPVALADPTVPVLPLSDGDASSSNCRTSETVS